MRNALAIARLRERLLAPFIDSESNVRKPLARPVASVGRSPAP